jgi:hypothetical protein
MSIYDRPAQEQLDYLKVTLRLDRDTAEWLRDLLRSHIGPEAELALESAWGLNPAIRAYDNEHRMLTLTIEAEAERQVKREAFLAKDEPVDSGRCEARVPDPRGWYPGRCTRGAKVRRPEHSDGEGPLLLCTTHRNSTNMARWRNR